MNLMLPDKRLALIGGGKKLPGEDWLSELPEGSQFYVKAIKPIGNQMPSSFLCQLGEVLKIHGPVRVIRMVQGENSAIMPVDPQGFCETFSLFYSAEDLEDEPDK